MMSLYDGIQHFLKNVGPTILEQGWDYYRQGCVDSVDFVRVAKARVLTRKLQQMYPRRPVLWDGQEQVEQRMKATVLNR